MKRRNSNTRNFRALSRRPVPSSDMPAVLNSISGDPVSAISIDALETVVLANPGTTVHAVIESFSSDPRIEGAALVQIIAFDEDNLRVPIPNWPHRSQRVDEYQYLAPGDPANPSVTHLSVTVPAKAKGIRLIGHTWKQAIKTRVAGEPATHRLGDEDPPFATSLGTNIVWPASVYRATLPIPKGARELSIDILAEATQGNDVNSPIAVDLLASNGQPLMPISELPQHALHGPFFTIKAPAGQQERNDFSIGLPRVASFIRLRGLAWGKKTASIVERPQVAFNTSSADNRLSEILTSVPPNEPLIVVDTTAPPLGHKTLSLRPNNLSVEFAQHGVHVLFIPFGGTQDQPNVINDHLVQIKRDAASPIIEAIVNARPDNPNNIYICSSFPSLECVTRTEYLGGRGWTTVYEVRDDMEEFNRAGYSKWYDPLLERRQLANSDIVLTVSNALTRKMQTLGVFDRDVHTMPNGVAETTLSDSEPLRHIDLLPTRNASKIVGYVGHLTPSWFDWPLLIAAAEQRPSVIFEIIGHGAPDSMSLPVNIELLGAKSHEELLPIVERWRLGLIPFVSTPLTRGVDPNKIYEYFAWGLRVLSAPMGSVQDYPSTAVYRNLTEFLEQLDFALSSDMTVDELGVISQFATNSSWRNRAQDMLALLTEDQR